jgi:hypothetical protein
LDDFDARLRSRLCDGLHGDHCTWHRPCPVNCFSC